LDACIAAPCSIETAASLEFAARFKTLLLGAVAFRWPSVLLPTKATSLEFAVPFKTFVCGAVAFMLPSVLLPSKSFCAKSKAV